MNMNLKDMIYSLFGVYAKSSKVGLISSSDLIEGSGTSVTTVMSGKVKTSRKSTLLSGNQMKLFRTTLSTRADILEAIDSVKYLDLSQQIIETIVNDAFNSFDAEEPFTIKYTGSTYDADEINAIIASTVKRLKLHSIFREIADDLVTYGEYYLETPCKDGVGVLELNDNIKLGKVISVYDSSELLYHIAERKTALGKEYVQVDKDALAHFILDAKRFDVGAGKFNGLDGVPETIKAGKSVLLPVLRLLQRYNLLDLANTANDLKMALMPPLIRVGYGEGLTPEQIIELTRKYEEYFMEMGDVLHGIDSNKELSPNQILQLATQVKVVPSADGKGTIEKQSFASDINLNESQEKLAERIKSTIGLPIDDQGRTRLTNLREKARYAKKLIDVQLGCAHSIVEGIILKDLRYQGIIIDSSNIKTTFKAVQNPNAEEDAEVMFHQATSARDIIRTYVETAQDIPGLRLNPKAAKTFLDSLMSGYGDRLADMLEVDPEWTGSQEPESEDEFDFDDSVSSDTVDNAGFVERPSSGKAPEEPLVDDSEPEIQEEPAETVEPETET